MNHLAKKNYLFNFYSEAVGALQYISRMVSEVIQDFSTSCCIHIDQVKGDTDLNASSSSSCRAASMDIPDPLSPLSFIASGRSSGLHPISSHSCCMYVLAGHPAFAWPYAGVHRSTSLMSSSLLL